MIDGLEAGANTLIITLGLCRLSYHGKLQEKILRRLDEAEYYKNCEIICVYRDGVLIDS